MDYMSYGPYSLQNIIFKGILTVGFWRVFLAPIIRNFTLLWGIIIWLILVVFLAKICGKLQHVTAPSFLLLLLHGRAFLRHPPKKLSKWPQRHWLGKGTRISRSPMMFPLPFQPASDGRLAFLTPSKLAFEWSSWGCFPPERKTTQMDPSSSWRCRHGLCPARRGNIQSRMTFSPYRPLDGEERTIGFFLIF